MRIKKIAITVFIFSTVFSACNDSLIDELDHSANDGLIKYRSGMLLDGDRDQQYDGILGRIEDKEGDNKSAPDIKECVLIQDDTYLWVFMDFYSSRPDYCLNCEYTFEASSLFDIDFDEDDYFHLSIDVSYNYLTETWESSSNLLSQVEMRISVNDGVELRIQKSAISGYNVFEFNNYISKIISAPAYDIYDSSVTDYTVTKKFWFK